MNSLPPTTAPPHADGVPLGPADVPGAAALTLRQIALMGTAGLVGAVAVPDNRPGLGLSLTWTAVVVAVLVSRPSGTWAGGWRRAMVALAATAGLLPAISDAGWTVAPALFTAVVAAVLAFAGGGSWLGLWRAAWSSLPAGLRSFAAVLTPLRQVVPADARRHPAVRATLLTVVLLGVFGALFASADRVFGRLVERFLVPELDLDLVPARLAVWVALTVGAATLVRLRYRGRDDRPLPQPDRRLQGVEWQLPLGSLVVLFAGFVALQFGVLFGGHERVLRTAGLTYAEYARGGFGQLLAVAALTLGVIAATRRYAASADPADARSQARLLAALCLLTLVVLASAWHRLSVYQDAYGFTRLRFAARGAIAWLAVVFVLLLVTAAVRRTRLLPRAVALLTVTAVVAVAFAQPDAQIARWNAERYAAEGRIDVAYLADLSADAVPALLRLPHEVRGCVLGPLADELDTDDRTWPEWGWSRHRARRLIAAHGPLPACVDVGRWG